MKVKELIKLLQQLDQDKIIDIAFSSETSFPLSINHIKRARTSEGRSDGYNLNPHETPAGFWLSTPAFPIRKYWDKNFNINQIIKIKPQTQDRYNTDMWPVVRCLRMRNQPPEINRTITINRIKQIDSDREEKHIIIQHCSEVEAHVVHSYILLGQEGER